MRTRSLDEFLLARYAEEREALDSMRRKRHSDQFSHAEMVAYTTVTDLVPSSLPPYEVDAFNQRLNEIQAHVLLVTRCQEAMLMVGPGSEVLVHFVKQTLWDLSRPYRTHRQFNEEWKP